MQSVWLVGLGVIVTVLYVSHNRDLRDSLAPLVSLVRLDNL